MSSGVATWRDILLEYRKLGVHDQMINKDLIIKAFKELWDSKPTESEFSTYMGGIVLWPEILYYMTFKREGVS